MFAWETWALAPDLRDLLRLVVLSLAFVGVSQLLFQRNAPSRRKFALWAAPLLLVTPWVVGALGVAIPVGVVEPPAWSLDWALPLWLVGSVLMVSALGLARVVYAGWMLQRQVMQLPLLDDPRLLRLSAGLMQPLSLRVQPNFRRYQPQLGLPCAPFASSKAQGQVVLPADYAQMDEDTLRAVVTHELVHLARRDDWGRLLVRAMVSVYWFLPWLRRFERHYLAAMEHSCDDRAADFFGPSLRYMEGVVGAAGLQLAVTTDGNSNSNANAGPSRSTRSANLRHPLLQRVLRFGHRREFDGDAMRVWGYLLLTTSVGLALVALQPIAKPQAKMGEVMAAGLSMPLPLAAGDAPAIPTPQVGVSLAQPQGQTRLTRALRPLDQPTPIYPGRALRAQLEGEVWVDYRIALDGSVVNPKVVHSKPAGQFERSALSAVRRTRYQHLSTYTATPLDFARTGLAVGELRVRQRFRYRLKPSR